MTSLYLAERIWLATNCGRVEGPPMLDACSDGTVYAHCIGVDGTDWPVDVRFIGSTIGLVRLDDDYDSDAVDFEIHLSEPDCFAKVAEALNSWGYTIPPNWEADD